MPIITGRGDTPFERTQICVHGKDITYGDLRFNAQAMVNGEAVSAIETGLAHAVLALLEVLEKKEEGK